MTTFLVVAIAAAALAAVLAWHNLRREPEPPPAPLRRFEGRGTVPPRVPARVPPARRGGAIGRTGTARRPAEPEPRIAGQIRRSPDAIGLACLRPISECTRGDACVCRD